MFRLVAKIIYTILLIIETFIAIRLVFIFLNASKVNEIVSFIYDISEYFVNPFNGIVADTVKIGRFTIDTTALLALIVYMVIAFIFIEMIRAFTPTYNPRAD